MYIYIPKAGLSICWFVLRCFYLPKMGFWYLLSIEMLLSTKYRCWYLVCIEMPEINLVNCIVFRFYNLLKIDLSIRLY